MAFVGRGAMAFNREEIIYQLKYRFERLKQQILRFCGVGICAAVIDYAILIFLTEKYGMYYLLSATIAFLISTVFNYFATTKLVFPHREGISRLEEFGVFLILSVIGLIINNVGMLNMVESLGVSYILAKFFTTIVVAIWNFVAKKFFFERRHKKIQRTYSGDCVHFRKE